MKNPMQETPANAAAERTLHHHLTDVELAARWHLTVKAIQAKRARGAGPRFLKLGSAVRYRLADIEAYEAAQERQSTAEAA